MHRLQSLLNDRIDRIQQSLTRKRHGQGGGILALGPAIAGQFANEHGSGRIANTRQGFERATRMGALILGSIVPIPLRERWHSTGIAEQAEWAWRNVLAMMSPLL